MNDVMMRCDQVTYTGTIGFMTYIAIWGLILRLAALRCPCMCSVEHLIFHKREANFR